MHSPLRYGPKCKETVGIGSLKERNPKSIPFDRFLGEANYFPVLVNIIPLVYYIGSSTMNVSKAIKTILSLY